MHRARSPFFYISLILLALVGICMGLGVDLAFQDVPWEGDRALVARLQTIALLIGFATGIPLIGILIAEAAIRRGWGPKGLRVRYIGAIIADVEPDPDRFDYAWFVVALPNKELERFQADPEEARKVKKGDCVTLEVIGQHVAEVRRMGGDTAEALEAQAKQPGALSDVRRHASVLRPKPLNIGSWLWAVLSPLAGGLMIGNQLMGFLQAELMYRRRRYSGRYLMTGTEAQLYAGLTILLGLVLIVSAIIAWKRGWNDDGTSGPSRWFRLRW